MSVCDCDDRLFHMECLREWLGARVAMDGTVVENDGDISLLRCDQCSYEIRFVQSARCRTKSCA